MTVYVYDVPFTLVTALFGAHELFEYTAVLGFLTVGAWLGSMRH